MGIRLAAPRVKVCAVAVSRGCSTHVREVFYTLILPCQAHQSPQFFLHINHTHEIMAIQMTSGNARRSVGYPEVPEARGKPHRCPTRSPNFLYERNSDLHFRLNFLNSSAFISPIFRLSLRTSNTRTCERITVLFLSPNSKVK